jgi:hypothetical protein
LPSAALRETTNEADEVVQVFTGGSLEEAMAYAVASLGPDLTVRRARKVRKGFQGLAGKDTYEVVALAPPSADGDGDAVGSAFDALLQQAEEVEAARAPEPARRTTRPATPSAEPAVLASVPESAVPESAVRPPELEPARVSVPAPRAAAPAPAAPVAPRRTPQPTKATRPTPATRPRAPRSTGAVVPAGWSRAALAAAGLPKPVLAALPARDPRDDAGWIRALTAALATVLPAAAPLGDDHPLTVNGHGLPGVLGILAASRRGFTPGTITYGGRTAPATATELALAVRAEVVR